MPAVIYLDYHATTPLDPAVLRAMMPYLQRKFYSASGAHFLAKQSSEVVEKARFQTASLIGADPSEIIFTSGATESNNLAIKGIAEAYSFKGRHIVTTQIEHKSVLDPMKRLEARGFRVTYLPVKKDGLLDVNELKKAVTKKTILISVIWAHNEIGVIQPIKEIGKLAQKKNIFFHSDAAQAAGKIAVSPALCGVDLLSFSSHKLYGPKGIGALYIRKKYNPINLIPQIDGGGQERGLRSGTLNVPAIVGFGAAAWLCRKKMESESRRLKKLRDIFIDKLQKEFPGLRINGSLSKRLPHNINVTFQGIPASDLLKNTTNVVFSSGSACLASSPEPSYTLRAMGLSEIDRKCSVRFGLGRGTTREEIVRAAEKIIKTATKIRKKQLSSRGSVVRI